LHLRFGQHNESFIAREFERATGLHTCEHQGTLFHREHGFMFGHVDRFLVKHLGELPVVDGVVVTDALLECKTASAFARNDWGTPGTDEVPPLYLVQCAWYLAITGCERCVLLRFNPDSWELDGKIQRVQLKTKSRG
jgi:predicted phage-related endonuclease